MAKLRPSSKTKPNRVASTAKPARSAEALMRDAFAYHQNGQNDAAITCCRAILGQAKGGETSESAGFLWVKLAPDDIQGWILLGQALHKNAKSENAIQALQIALRLDPHSIDALNQLAIAQKHEGFLNDALQTYQRMLALKPGDKKILTNRINVLLDMGLWDEAKADIDALLVRHPHDAPLLALAGRYHNTLGQPLQALPYLEKAYKQDPDSASILINLAGTIGKTMEELNNKAKFYQIAKRAVQLIETKKLVQYESQRGTMAYFIAVYENRPIHGGDMIVKGRNLDEVVAAERNIDVQMLGPSRRLYEFRDCYTHTGEWTIYNNDQIFMNLMVVGSKKHTTFSDTNDVYLNEYLFPQIYLREPHILLGGAENYYHWWIDFMPRAAVILESPELRNLPIIILDTLNDNQIACLAKIGIDPARLIRVPNHHTIKCDHLFVPHLLGRPMTEIGLPDWMKPMINDWGVNWVREQFRDWRQPKAGQPKRIFISREKARFRRCINEAEVYAIAQRHGFTTLQNEHMSFADQMALYAGVDMVMGPHGAGFTNMLFAPTEATAIEMFPKHRAPPFYRDLCGQLGQRYIKFDGPITNLPRGMAVDFGDFYIDPQDVERILGTL